MKNEMSKLRECSRKKVLRMIHKGDIAFVDGKFHYLVSGKPMELKYKNKFREDIDEEDDVDFDDFMDKSGSFIEETKEDDLI